MVDRLVGDRVLVKLEPTVEELGGIYIPEESQNKTYKGLLVMVGEQCQEKMLKTGMTVFFTKYAGTDIKMGGEAHAIMRTEDIIAVQRTVK